MDEIEQFKLAISLSMIGSLIYAIIFDLDFIGFLTYLLIAFSIVFLFIMFVDKDHQEEYVTYKSEEDLLNDFVNGKGD